MKNSSHKIRFPDALLAFFSSLLVIFFLYGFYSTELYQQLENVLFDLRTQIKPQIVDSSQITLLGLRQSSFSRYLKTDLEDEKIGFILKILKSALKNKPKLIGLVLPSQDFDYESLSFKKILEFMKEHDNIFLGVFNSSRREASDDEPLSGLSLDRIFNASTLRHYRQEVVRSIPIMSYMGEELRMDLITKLAYEFTNDRTSLDELTESELTVHNPYTRKSESSPHELPQIYLNYFLPKKFNEIHVDAFLSDQKLDIEGKILLIGYQAFRKRDINHRDGTFVNTPWDGDNNPEVFATPLLYVHAVGLQNLLNSSWLTQAHPISNIIQTGLFSVLSFSIWQFAPAVAALGFLVLLFLTLYLHGFLFSFASLYIPLADTAVFSFLFTIFGAFLRARSEGQKIIQKKAKMLAQQELAGIQSRFLDRFAFEIYDINQKILDLIKNHSETNKLLIATSFRLQISSEELQDYLYGIKNYCKIRKNHDVDVQKEIVDLESLTRRVLNQLEAKIGNKKIKIRTNFVESLGWTDPVLIEPIVFNLISNAVKYSPKESVVEIFTKNMSRKKIQYSVRDYGVGIEESLHEKIFEKFYRVKNDDVYVIKGNGLGLYLCKYFSEKLKIHVHVNSSLGNGSTFSLTLRRSNRGLL